MPTAQPRIYEGGQIHDLELRWTGSCSLVKHCVPPLWEVSTVCPGVDGNFYKNPKPFSGAPVAVGWAVRGRAACRDPRREGVAAKSRLHYKRGG